MTTNILKCESFYGQTYMNGKLQVYHLLTQNDQLVGTISIMKHNNKTSSATFSFLMNENNCGFKYQHCLMEEGYHCTFYGSTTFDTILGYTIDEVKKLFHYDDMVQIKVE